MPCPMNVRAMTTSTADSALDAAAVEAALIRKVAWRLMPLIMISYFFAFFDGFAKAQLQADIGLSNTAYGLGRACSTARTG
jgi:hypothetical protein